MITLALLIGLVIALVYSFIGLVKISAAIWVFLITFALVAILVRWIA